MNSKRVLVVALAFVFSLGLCSISQATTIFADDFESYADTTAMNAVWSNGGTATLDPNQGNPNNPGNSMFHPGTAGSFSGGNTNSVTFLDVTPTTTEPVVFSADIYDDGSSSNKRITAGLRDAAVGNLIEMGLYNNPSHYAIRAAVPGPSYVAFSNLVDDAGDPLNGNGDNVPVVGWHRFQMVHDGTNATFTLDLNSDGNINATINLPLAFAVANPWDIIRLGGPSDVSSAGGGGNFDNISLVQIPEPATVALISLAGIGLVARRRR